MGEKKIEDEKPVAKVTPMLVTIETAIMLLDDGVSDSTIRRAIEDGSLKAFKPGKCILIDPVDLQVWAKRFLAS